MAPLTKTLALAGSLLAAFGSAAPLNKRDANGNVHVVYETATTVVWTTVDLTTTIYANAPAPTAAAQTNVVSVTQAAPSIQTPDPQPAPEPEPEPTTEEAQPTQPAQPTTTQVEEQEPEPTEPAVTSVAQPTYTPEPQPEPEPQQPTTAAAAQPTTAAAQPAPTTGNSGSGSSSGSSGSSSSSSGGGSWSAGDVTFYDTATSASAPSSCGFTNDGSSENVVALSHEIMQDSDCGKTVTIQYGGKSTTGKVVDKCMGCNAGSIDLSRHMFLELAPETEGRLTQVKWKLN